MASYHLLITISMLLLLPLAFPAIATERNVNVVVEGMVYCQSCEHIGTWSLTGAEPIPSANVSVICKNHQDNVNFYKVFQTDGNGHFYAQLEGFKMSNCIFDHPLQSCRVKLVSSPLENCNLFSNVNDALNGAPLRYENKRLIGSNYEAAIYAAGPLAFHPARCAPTIHF